MSKKSTYGELIESLTALIGLLGVVLCLQTGMASIQLQDDLEQKHCCIQVAGHAHDHTESSALTEQIPAIAPLHQLLVKGFSDAAALQKSCALLQLKAYALEVQQQYVIHSFAPLLSKRHILYRSIII